MRSTTIILTLACLTLITCQEIQIMEIPEEIAIDELTFLSEPKNSKASSESLVSAAPKPKTSFVDYDLYVFSIQWTSKIVNLFYRHNVYLKELFEENCILEG
jgi:hypothetical protein